MCYNCLVADNRENLFGREPLIIRVKNFVQPILILALIGYVIFILYQAVYYNFKVNQKIRELKGEINTLDQEKSKLEALIAYYKTETFQELEARKKLGLRLPGEKVVKVEVIAEEAASPTSKPDAVSPQSNKPNWQLWLDYLRGEEV